MATSESLDVAIEQAQDLLLRIYRYHQDVEPILPIELEADLMDYARLHGIDLSDD